MSYLNRIPELQKNLAKQVTKYNGTGQLKSQLLETIAETPILGELKATFDDAYKRVNAEMAMAAVIEITGAASHDDKDGAKYIAAIVGNASLSHNDIINDIIDITGDLEKSEDDASYGYRPH